MPDIDIDFDDEGRGRVMDYVIEKYGSNQVITRTMAAKSSIRDTHVLTLPLGEAIVLLVLPNMKLGKNLVPDVQLKENLRAEEVLGSVKSKT